MRLLGRNIGAYRLQEREMPVPKQSIFRVDKFSVPSSSRDPFLAKIRETHALLDGVEGCLQNIILEQKAGTSRYNIVTIVEWRDVGTFERAKQAAQARHAASGFDPKVMFATLGIEADLGNYQLL